MITDRDIEKLKEFFPDNEKFDKYTQKVLDKLDKVMGELETIRQEQTVGSQIDTEHIEQLEKLETCLTHLEKRVQS